MPAPQSSPEGSRENTTERGRRAIRERVCSPVNETKLAMLDVLRAFGRPVTASELHQTWNGTKSFSIIDYHLCTLVEMGVVKPIIGPELLFQIE